MKENKIEGVIFNKLNIIKVPGGDVYHGLKKSDLEFNGFGEAYFSSIYYKEVKAWKKHKRMTMNLIVPVGQVKFVFKNEANLFTEYIIGENNYGRITVSPNVWFGFQGVSKNKSLILNLSNIIHSPEESEKVNMIDINYNWEFK